MKKIFQEVIKNGEAVAEILNYDLPKPEIREVSGGINVDIFAETKDLEKDLEKDPEKDLEKDTLKLSKNQERISSEMRKNPVITQKELSERVGISEKNIRNNITKLKALGVVRRIGPDKGGHWEVAKK